MATAFNQQQGNNGSAWGDSGGLDWQEALREFLLHQEATRASSTVRFYRNNLSQLIRWAEENQGGMLGFGKRHLDRYLEQCLRDGRAQMTARRDAVSIRAHCLTLPSSRILTTMASTSTKGNLPSGRSRLVFTRGSRTRQRLETWDLENAAPQSTCVTSSTLRVETPWSTISHRARTWSASSFQAPKACSLR